MKQSLEKILNGYHEFREKYAQGDSSIMRYLSLYGQNPKVMVVACCDSRVDPALLLQCDPGDLFVVRNVANIVPPYEKDEMHHGTSAALEFGICFLNVKHLILLGHSQCGGINALIDSKTAAPNDFISNWVSIINTPTCSPDDLDNCAKQALHQSYQNCMSFPWIKEKVANKELEVHQWFFDIKDGQIETYSNSEQIFKKLE